MVIASCEKSDEPTVSNESVPTNEKSANQQRVVIDAVPNNPLNPYDSAGYWHNAGLDYLGSFIERRTDAANAIH